jgi:predicted membrane protein
MIKIALGIILMAAPTALFLCIFPLGLAGLAWSEGGDWVGLLVFAALITASHAALLVVAAKSFQHEYGRKTAEILISIGVATPAVLIGIVSGLQYLGKI